MRQRCYVSRIEPPTCLVSNFYSHSAEFYDVTSQSVDYYAKIPAGTQVQVYVADQNSGQEWWGGIVSTKP